MISRYSFTEAVRIALAGARQKALELGHHHVQIEHLLLTPIERGDPMTMAIWRQLAVDPVALVQSIRGTNPPDPPSSAVSDLPYTAQAERALEAAMQQARDLADNYVWPACRAERARTPHTIQSTGCRIGKFRRTSATTGSGSRRCHSSSQLFRPMASAPKSNAGCLTGQSFQCITSRGYGHVVLSTRYGRRNSMPSKTPRPSGPAYVTRFSRLVERRRASAAITDRWNIEYPNGFVRASSRGKLPS